MKGISDLGSGRWSTYFLRSGEELEGFWTEYLGHGEKQILFVLGAGFDPRMYHGFSNLIQIGGQGRRDCLALELNEGVNSPSNRYSDMVKTNLEQLTTFIPKGSRLSFKPITMWTQDSRRMGSRSAANVFRDLSELSGYTDVIVDISAMPRGIYFPLIGKLLHLLDSATARPSLNLHILVSENVGLDAKIKDEGIDEDASYMHGFTGALETETGNISPKVWIPILGERQGLQLDRIYDLVKPDEICPMLPMPSSNARRGDDLLMEYRELLFDVFRVEPSNFLQAAEKNPFAVYREIRRTILHYRDALRPLGGCQTVISALSSKLLSLGALLAAYELKNLGVGVAHVETQGYQIEEPIDRDAEMTHTDLSLLWLWGDCYLA